MMAGLKKLRKKHPGVRFKLLWQNNTWINGMDGLDANCKVCLVMCGEGSEFKIDKQVNL